MIEKFIIWYLKRHNVMFKKNGYVVRMFTEDWYDRYVATIRGYAEGIRS